VASLFRKSFKVAPGVRLTASKRGVSASVGPRGAKPSTNARRGRRVSLSFKGLRWVKRRYAERKPLL
jgi:hypothetical protein